MTFLFGFCILKPKRGQVQPRLSALAAVRVVRVHRCSSSYLWILLIQTERLQPAVGIPAAGGKAMRFYRSPKWEHKRAKILRRDGYLCQISKRYGKTVPAETVHHIFPRDEFPEYQLSDWNLISLSASVHDTMHDRTSGKLSPAGAELLRRTCRKYGREIPDQYKE